MQFELDSALTDEILFFMEDQDGKFFLDTAEGTILSAEDDAVRETDDAEKRYVSLPGWGPAEGFRLMERFISTLRNALVREELNAALERGRGVFRSFKNTLARYPETEKLWHAYKNREMKRVVISWYNSLREIWGLEIIGEEPEDISGLALEDFRFRKGSIADSDQAAELHRICIAGYASENSGAETLIAGDILSGDMDAGRVFPGDICFTAETAGGEFSGYICAVRKTETVLCICVLEIKPEYRGLGLGKALLSRILEYADSEKIKNVIIDLPAEQEKFSRALLRENFKPCLQRYCRAI